MARISDLRKKHINKNGNIQKKHTINKIKSRETKYTIILVVFFMLCFCIIGYNVLSFNPTPLLNDVKGVSSNRYVTSSSQVVTLTDDDIMSDANGLVSTSYKVVVDNTTAQEVSYQLLFERDRDMTLLCECSDRVFNSSQIKYSLNGTDVNVFNEDMVIKEVTLNQGDSEEIYLKLWIDSSVMNVRDYHFHGHFVLKEIKG